MNNLKIDQSINKHKDIRRDTPGMNFGSYAERIKVLRGVNSERADKNDSKRITKLKIPK